MRLLDIIAQSGEDLLAHAAERLQFRLPTDPVPASWNGILDRNVPLARSLDASRDAVDAADAAPLSDYATRNHAEFFAVATEAFFCQPVQLRERLPVLYTQLQRFYRRPT